MKLGLETNGKSNELKMQEQFESWIKEHNEMFELKALQNKFYKKHIIQYKREVHVPEVNRIADFLLIRAKKLINIELKTNPNQKLIDQLMDHKRYCDYSFALVPDFCVLPQWITSTFLKNGIGLILYNHNKEIFTECLPAYYNSERLDYYKKNTLLKYFNRVKS